MSLLRRVLPDIVKTLKLVIYFKKLLFHVSPHRVRYQLVILKPLTFKTIGGKRNHRKFRRKYASDSPGLFQCEWSPKK